MIHNKWIETSLSLFSKRSIAFNKAETYLDIYELISNLTIN